MVYGNGASVYITGRSEAKLSRAVKDIQAAISSRTTGEVSGLTLDLEDLAGIKDFANGFLKKENRLDVLVHNAGLMTPPTGSKSKLVCRILFSLRFVSSPEGPSTLYLRI